ncbi:MAG: hypothetical protein ABID38_06805 [Candidatus Diapherotrites archaeon]
MKKAIKPFKERRARRYNSHSKGELKRNIVNHLVTEQRSFIITGNPFEIKEIPISDICTHFSLTPNSLGTLMGEVGEKIEIEGRIPQEGGIEKKIVNLAMLYGSNKGRAEVSRSIVTRAYDELKFEGNTRITSDMIYERINKKSTIKLQPRTVRKYTVELKESGAEGLVERPSKKEGQKPEKPPRPRNIRPRRYPSS